jgi:hypothetical protein
MWAYLFSKPRTEGATDEVELKREDQEFSTPILEGTITWVLRAPLFIHLGKKRVWVLVKADLNDEQASILSDNDRLLTGTTKLLWWEPVMIEDFRRTLDNNEARAESLSAKLEASLEEMFQRAKSGSVGSDEESTLASLTKKVESMSDGPDKYRLLEVLRGCKETQH